MCTGDIYALDPINGGGFPLMPNLVTDPDLLAVANSVPGMIGQSFSVSSINDVAILEFDFVPTSDSMEFRYAFGSQEYFCLRTHHIMMYLVFSYQVLVLQVLGLMEQLI